MDPSSVLRSVMKIYSIGNSRSSTMTYCCVFSVYMLGQTIISCIMRWDTLKFRYLALEDVACTVFSTAMIFEHALFPESIFKLTGIIERGVFSQYDNVIGSSTRTESLVQNETVSAGKQTKNFVLILSFFIFNFTVPCFVISWYRIVSNYLRNNGRNKMALTDLVLPYESWFPFEPDNESLAVLCAVLTVCNALYLIIVAHHMLLSMGSTIASIRRIASDIKLLQISIEEIETVYKNEDDRTQFLTKKYLGCIVDHHNLIIRNVKKISRALSFSSLNMHTCALLLSGLSMYWFIEGSSSLDRTRYIVSVITVAAIVYAYSVNGQIIQTEGEKLRHVLYAYSWADKPSWFKKYFLIIMTQATKSLQVKPLGLYVLDFNSFTSMLNAAYAFTNILRTFKKRQHFT